MKWGVAFFIWSIILALKRFQVLENFRVEMVNLYNLHFVSKRKLEQS